MIKCKIRATHWWTFPLIIVNFNHFFIQPAPGVFRDPVLCKSVADTYDDITFLDIVLDDLIASRQLDVGQRPRVRDIWLKKHRHLYERRKSTAKKKTTLSALRGSKKSSTVPSNLNKGTHLIDI